MKTLPEIVKEMRDLGMTQTEVAEATHLSQAHISNIEAGKRGSRTPATTLEQAAAALEQKKRELGVK